MMASSLMEQRWFTPGELAEKLGVSVRTLDAWRRKGRGPRYFKVSYRTVKYAAEDLEVWLQSLRGRTSRGRYREGLERPRDEGRPGVASISFPGPGTRFDQSRRYRIRSERG
ncbi:MAG: helix-turn-helix domain-containing protein [Bryobacteraceae bacterium]|jgi:transcriptional regulator with XRE-family HTH domain